jgi:hypothetical protein
MDYIKQVVLGDNSESIAIVVEQMHGSVVLQWSLINDQELNAWEVEKEHEIIWD